MVTTFDELPAELFYEIFAYFSFHEQYECFSNLNSRLAAILAQLSSISAYVGFNGMSIALTRFYHNHLCEPNITDRLKTLCVSDTLAFGNGAWLASHLHLFVGLRHLALIDIQRADLESICNALSSVGRLVRFEVWFTVNSRALYSYRGVAEGTYHEQIFCALPQLRICQLRFVPRMYFTAESIQSDLLMPINSSFVVIQTTLANLESLALSSCSLAFLSHLLQFVPQLRTLSFCLVRSWRCGDHSLTNGNFVFNDPIDRSLVPNLRRLRIHWSNYLHLVGVEDSVQLPTELFSRDVFFHLTHLTLVANQLDEHVVRHLLSMLSAQCFYSFEIQRKASKEPSMTNTLVQSLIRQLKGSEPIQVELNEDHNQLNVSTYTLPRKCHQMDLTTYFSSKTWLARDRLSNGKISLLRSFPNVNKVILNERYESELDENWLSHMASIVSWHQIVDLNVHDTLNWTHLRSILNHLPRLRTLELARSFHRIHDFSEHNRHVLIDLLEDSSMCDMLKTNGLRKLVFSVSLHASNGIHLAHMIVQHLPYLQIVQIFSCQDYMPLFLHTLINGLPNLTFLVANCGSLGATGNWLDLLALQTADMRSFRTEVQESLESGFIYIWL